MLGDYNKNNITSLKVKGYDIKYTSLKRFQQLIEIDGYEKFSVKTVLNALKNSKIFLDIGSYHGLFSLIAAKNYPKLKVYSFEPSKNNLNILKKNIRDNNLKNIKYFNFAISSENTTKTFNIADASDSSSLNGHPLTPSIKKQKVTVRTIDSMNLKDIDLIKIDTEGNEIEVLQGMVNTMKRNPYMKLLIEFNPKCLRHNQHNPEKLIVLLENNYDLFLLDDKNNQSIKINSSSWADHIDIMSYKNLFCIPKRESFSVLFFNHTAGLGGSERSLLQLVEEFIEKGVRCRIVLPYEGPLSKKLEEIGAEYEIINYHWWCSEKKMNNEIIENTMFESINNLLNSKKSLDGFNPDVIFTNTLTIPWGALYSKLVNKPHLTFIREFGTLDFGFEFFYGFEESMKFINDNSDFVFTNSKATLNYFKKYIDNKKLDYSYAYIEIDKNKLKTNTRIYKRKKSLKLILTGGILPTKGQDIAAKAISSLIKKELDVELILLGPRYDQDYYEKICNYIENNNLTNSISFIDYVDNPLSYVNQADIVLMCSKSEAYGRVTIEGMALKKTIIGTNSGATKELLQNNEKVLFKPGDYYDLANKIDYFANNKDQINKFGVSNFNFYKKYVRRGVYGSKVLKKLKLIGLNKPPVSRNILNILLTHLSKKLEGKNVEIRVLNSKLNSSIKSKEENIKDLQKTIDNNVAILNKIYTSKTWKLLNLYKKFLAFFKKK